jgi:hypothetical protein
MSNLDYGKTENFHNLLKQTSIIIQHHIEKEKLKGETFNVFSILKLESHENKTHSAFLGELLNPKGSHLMGTTFLELFLSVIGIENSFIDVTNAFVKLEHSIGAKDLENKTGGRIDIYISDKKNHLSIENKIYAGDQVAQIERYCNYNKEKNRVVYLTLFGTAPSIESKGQLRDEDDFLLISYKQHIVQWLELCIKESYGTPILRETIKQYQILLKKLTNSMDKSDDKKLKEVMLFHYTEAEFIANNFEKMRIDFANQNRRKIITLLKERLKENYLITEGNPVTKAYSQIWIKPTELSNKHLYFGFESFSINNPKDKPYFIGVFNSNGDNIDSITSENFEKHNSYWLNIKAIEPFHGFIVNNQHSKTLHELHKDESFKRDFFENITKEIADYLDLQTPLLKEFFEKNPE